MAISSLSLCVSIGLHVNYIIIPTLRGDQEITLFKYRNLMNIHELCVSQKRKCLLSDSSSVSGIMEKKTGSILEGETWTERYWRLTIHQCSMLVHLCVICFLIATGLISTALKRHHHGWQQTLNIYAFCIIHLFSNCIAEILSRLLNIFFEVVSLYTANMNYFNSACNALFNCPTKIQQSAITVYD